MVSFYHINQVKVKSDQKSKYSQVSPLYPQCNIFFYITSILSKATAVGTFCENDSLRYSVDIQRNYLENFPCSDNLRLKL